MKKKTTKEILEFFSKHQAERNTSFHLQGILDGFSRSWRSTLKKRLKTCRLASTRREILETRNGYCSMRDVLLERETAVSDALLLTYPDFIRSFATWLLQQNPDTSLWSAVPQDWRILLAEHVFGGERFPDSAIREACRPYHDMLDSVYWRPMFDNFPPFAPPCLVPSYLPSKEVNLLRHLIDLAGDTTTLSYVDQKITERKSVKFSSFSHSPFTEYHIPQKEKKLLGPLVRAIKSAGFSMLPYPSVELSYADPPLFLSYPHLSREGRKRSRDFDEEKIPEDGIFDIENILALYLWNEERIVIFEKGIFWCATRLKADPRVLRWVVLVHELGHWLSHVLPQENPPSTTPLPVVPRWSLDTCTTTSTNVHEGLAQFFCHWLVEHHRPKHPEYAKVFDDLNQNQSPPYKVYKEVVQMGKKVDQVLQSVALLRQLGQAADKKTWFALIP